MAIDSNLDINKVTAVPPTIDGCEFVGPKLIQLSQIYVNSQENNYARAFSKDQNHVTNLKSSFQNNGIDYNQRLPVVTPNDRIIDGVHYTHDGRDLSHRMDALIQLGCEQWIFWEYNLPVGGYSYMDALLNLQLTFNNHSVSKISSADDVAGAICFLIKTGSKLVENKEDSIREYVKKYCGNMSSQAQNLAIRKAMAKMNTYRRIVTYTAEDTKNWIEKNTDLKHSGNFDNKRKQYAWNVLEGYEYEFLMNAIKKYGNEGHESYFVLRTKAPTESRTLQDRREGMVDEFENLEYCFLQVMNFYQKHKRFPWRSLGYMPQDHEVENPKEMIPI